MSVYGFDTGQSSPLYYRVCLIVLLSAGYAMSTKGLIGLMDTCYRVSRTPFAIVTITRTNTTSCLLSRYQCSMTHQIVNIDRGPNTESPVLHHESQATGHILRAAVNVDRDDGHRSVQTRSCVRCECKSDRTTWRALATALCTIERLRVVTTSHCRGLRSTNQT